MYLEFFNFSRKPFNSSPDPDCFYLTASAREAQNRLVAAIRDREPCLLLSGEPGTGKTALLKRLMMKDDLGVRWIFLNKAHLAWNELLMLIGRDLELSEEALYSSSLAEAVSQKMAESASRGLYPVLIIDEADHFRNPALRKLLAWQASNRARGVPLTIIFSGLKRLAQIFAGTGQGFFPNHPIDCCELQRFDLRETRTVIDYRLDLAGYRGVGLFENEALELIQKLSGGIPRVINLICDLGLVLAASIKEQRITPQIVQEASEYILLDRYPRLEKGSSGDHSELGPGTPKPFRGAVSPKPEEPVVICEPQPRFSTPGFSWRWAAVALLFVVAGGGAWIWLKYRPALNAFENSRKMVFKVPPAPENGRYDIPASSAVTSFLETVSEKQQEAGSQGGLAGASAGPVSAAPKLAFSSSLEIEEAGSEALADLAVKKEPVALAASVGGAPPSPAQVAAQGPLPPEKSPAESPGQATTGKGIASVSPVFPAPGSEQRPDPASLKAESIRFSGSGPEPQKSFSAKDPSPKGAALISAVENGNVEEIRRLLEMGADVDEANATGETALMKAAWSGRADIIALLLNHNPRINRQSSEGWTALFYAAVKGHKSVVTSLLHAGAIPDISDLDGRTALMAAAWNGHADIAGMLLDRSGNPNRKNREGWTPLMFAALEGHIDVAEILLRGGANPAVKNNEGNTSAQLAAYRGHTGLLSLLATHGRP